MVFVACWLICGCVTCVVVGLPVVFNSVVFCHLIFICVCLLLLIAWQLCGGLFSLWFQGWFGYV